MFCWKGTNIQVALFGTSHAPQIGVEVTGLPNEDFSEQKLLQFLQRRKGGSGVFATSRKEPDVPVFEKGVSNGKIVGDTLRAVIFNTDVKSADYSPLYGKPRPSHADYAAYCKDGRLDFSGGGEFSGRMTAPYAIAGGIAKQLLEKRGIFVNAYVSAVGGVVGKSYKDGALGLEELQLQQNFPSLSQADQMLCEIASARSRGDSVGGVVDCVVHGLPAGVGNALFGGLEGTLSYLLFAIPAVKGVEFGQGFGLASMCGSAANDAWQYCNGKVVSATNRSGGINGGVSNGMPVTLSVAFRPTPSIALPQKTVDLVSKQNTTVQIGGRHDACIVPRAVPVVEGAVALALLDAVL